MSSTIIPIDKGIPCPPWRVKAKGKKLGERKIRQWSRMEVGDSFFEPCKPAQAHRLRTSVSAGASAAGARLGRRFETRIVPGGVRVWRTK